MKIKYLFYLSLFFLQFCAYKNTTTEPNSNLYHTLDSLSISISQKLEKHNISTLAIMRYTDTDGKNNSIGSYISDEIMLQLFLKETFQIIEREQIDYIINEQKLGSSGLINEDSAIDIGNILSVDAIILGTISDINNNIIINTKVVSSGTGQIIFMDKSSIIKNNDIDLIALNNSELDQKNKNNTDIFSNKDPKSYDRSIRKLSRNFLNCLKNNDYKCYSQFMATKDQLRRIFLIKHQKDTITRKRKTQNLHEEYKKYRKQYKQNFINTIKRLKNRNINWNKINIEEIDFRVIKNYDQKKLFNINLIVSDNNQKHIHLGFNAFKLNGKWIINELGVKRKK